MQNLGMILEACRRNAWSYDTPNVAGKIYNVLKPFGYSRRTVRDYIRTVVDLLETEKKTHEHVKLTQATGSSFS